MFYLNCIKSEWSFFYSFSEDGTVVGRCHKSNFEGTWSMKDGTVCLQYSFGHTAQMNFVFGKVIAKISHESRHVYTIGEFTQHADLAQICDKLSNHCIFR